MMQWTNTTERYGALSIGTHWLMLLLLIAVYVCSDLREIFPKGSYLRDAMKDWHTMLGMLVFALVWLRLAFSVLGTKPVNTAAAPARHQQAAALMRVALYVLMIGLPLTGWLALSAAGKPIPFFGLDLPPLIGQNQASARVFKDIHEIAGSAGYALIGLHAAAALFHHYVMHDSTLVRMLPRRG